MRASLLPVLAPAAASLFTLFLAGQAAAGCSSGCASCCLPTTHTVNVPGVTVTPPHVVIQPPGLAFAGVGSTSVDVSVSASASADAQAQAQGSALANAQGSALANSATVANLLASGGGSSFFVDQGPSSTIGVLQVDTPQAAPPVCLQYAATSTAVAVQAVCLDDKDVPHPASQVSPGRDVAGGYSGELFRCIAGSRMQYVLGSFAGEARFEHGQTVVCRKGDALWRDLGGRLQCRPQTPARDCNERSLLRRYGAGIKVVAAQSQQCVRWGGGAVAEAQAGPVTGFVTDGGVGGVAH